MILKLKGRRFDTIEEIQAESQRVLDTDRKGLSRKRTTNGGDVGTSVYMREGTTSRVMAAERPYGEFYGFYSVSLQGSQVSRQSAHEGGKVVRLTHRPLLLPAKYSGTHFC
jgi:hypothetical protein